jgi:hypothetical protein
MTMANNYDVVMQEVDRRIAALVHKGLSEVDATSKVFRDDGELYQRYAKASAEAPERTASAPRLSAEPTGAQADVLRKAESLVSKSTGVSLNDAVATVLNSDAALYERYRKQDSTPATFSSELLSSEMDDFYEYTGALLRTMAGILDSSAEDKGPRIAGALGEFSAAVLGKLRQAGLSVPTEKRAPQHPLADDILACAQVLAPGDLGQGLVKVRYALGEIRKIAERKRAAA